MTQGLTHNSWAGIPKRTLPNCHSKEVNSNQRGSHLCSKWPKCQEHWRRGATGFCKLSWQLLVVVKLWLLFLIVPHPRLILVVYAWWILLQSWGTMRFSDRRGLKPSDVQVTGNTMAAKLTRSETPGDVKEVAFRMVHISSCSFLSSVIAVMAQHRLGSPEKSRRLSKIFSFASSFFQLQRFSSERTQVRHRLSDADQSSVIPAVRRPEQSDTISSCILDTAFRQSISSKRHSSSGCVEGTTGLPRRMECAGQRQLLQSRSSDVLESSETRHQCQAEFVRRPFPRGGHSLATGRPPLPKRLLSGSESKVLQRP